MDDIYNALIREEHEITLDETTSEKAMACINKMFEIMNPKTVISV